MDNKKELKQMLDTAIRAIDIDKDDLEDIIFNMIHLDELPNKLDGIYCDLIKIYDTLKSIKEEL